jgi:hypothetical protein
MYLMKQLNVMSVAKIGAIIGLVFGLIHGILLAMVPWGPSSNCNIRFLPVLVRGLSF